MQTCYLF